MLKALVRITTIGAAFVLAGCASFQQKPDEVFLRDSNHRLEMWKPLSEASAIHLPYAWASVSAYLHGEDGKEITVTESCPEPHAFLIANGWKLWEELPRVGRLSKPTTTLEQEMQDAHLRVEVWEHRESNTVMVAFGGTASLRDIGANARWFLPGGDPDAYEVLTKSYVRAFIEAHKVRASNPDGAWLKGARIVSTGHSLGGGLAQRFAYSLKPSNDMEKVHEVYAFNPSPVSGKRSVPWYEETAKGLTIYRIYNRGEILAGLRSFLQLWNPGNMRNDGQTWVDIRYSSGWGWRALQPVGWLKAHGMHDLACYMKLNLPSSP